MTLTMEQIGARTADYLTEKWGKPVQLVNIEKIFGGASRETYRLQLALEGDEAGTGVILRRDPPSSLIDTERELEFRAY